MTTQAANADATEAARLNPSLLSRRYVVEMGTTVHPKDRQGPGPA